MTGGSPVSGNLHLLQCGAPKIAFFGFVTTIGPFYVSYNCSYVDGVINQLLTSYN